ncbi:hypothetical protein GLOIN_2v1785865 [Rhizophagus irregularis DAOM 181602=DAOM 197198]|uniref:Uncharacterized protein n=1 Tax=Rhizophagus irregularis (strain DAOM 181602 / DAOM 197198 / MUCL 43194) TaxID=747089 RepID=A0A2P4P9C9_RHIID|nr:hypothetical protein GLOIN_2v1785865 [Rhizophagus irregularis DAOM 181602=DAOM 197198]POG62000.1 hypothetical protein GLOIN_2v1785865 [Rhizophagus irregularis DAOM 181602=DAOM 197198]|eukprot:XP_025168866.1 hypothetical protein GLOIN_2v1785865 [Rhizophagus irregularis DAOM 181602=DAOM 197198]
MRYNILDTAKSSATEARNLFRRHWDDIIGTIEEFLTSNPDATLLAPESASALASIDQDIEQDGRADDNTAEKLRDIIRIECEKLRENGNTIWRKRVLDLIEILQVSTLEVSGSPSCPDHTHYVGDRNKTAKMLKIILNFIKVNYPGDFREFRRIKVYGVQIYDHDFYIYSMCMPFAGVYYFKLEKKFSYSTIPALLFKELLNFSSNLLTMRDMIISSTKSVMSYITNPISESSDDAKIDKVKTSPKKKKNN